MAASLNLDDLLPIRILQVNGTDLDFVAVLDFGAGFTTSVTQANDATTGEPVLALHVTAGNAAVYEKTASYNVGETSGVVYVGLSSLSADTIVRAPASPSAGMQIVIAAEDTALSDQAVTFDGNGHNVQVGTASGTTYAITSDDWGDGGSVTFLFTGTKWKAI